MAYAYQHLKKPQNAEPGVADLLYVALVDDFAPNGIACVPDNTEESTTVFEMGHLTTITTDHEFQEGKGFLEIICAPFENEIKAATQGEIGSLNFLPQLTVFVPGNYAALHGTIKAIKNKPLIVLAKDMNCGSKTVAQIGCDCIHAWVASAEYNSGKGKGGGRKGYTIVFESVSAAALNHYSGAIVTQPIPAPEPPEEDPEEGG